MSLQHDQDASLPRDESADGRESPFAIWAAYDRCFASSKDFFDLGRSLQQAGRLPDAQRVLRHALKIFPDDHDLLHVLGSILTQQKDWAEACRHYQIIWTLLPDDVAAITSLGWALWESERFDEADVVLSRGVELAPANVWPAIHYAMSALNARRWPAAAERYGRVRTLFPEHAAGFVEGGWALREAGRVEEADLVLRQAVEKFPGEGSAWLHYGRNASVMTNWHEAVARWEACRARFPEAHFWERELRQARYEEQFAAASNPSLPQPKDSADDHDRPDDLSGSSDQDVMMAFESLGSDCEFGLVQRHFGAEPLGLLRFGEVPNLEFLLNALRTRFQGVGDEENTRGDIAFANEYIIRSSAGFTLMHTHVYEASGVSLEDTVRKMRPKLKYLARRLIETLEEGNKIFVYKQNDRLSDGDIDALDRVLKEYGPCRLLCIQQPDDMHQEGSVFRLKDRIAFGFVNFPARFSGQLTRADAWAKVCRLALRCF